MNSHFQSSEATWIRRAGTLDAIGLRGLKSCAPTHATPPTRNTVMAGIDQTSISRRPEYAKSGRYRARSFDARNQKATPSVATITGITIASMMPSELSRICRLATAIGPCGSRTPSLQPPSVAAPIRTTASKTYRMSDLAPAEVIEAVRPANGAWVKLMRPSGGRTTKRRTHRRSATSVINQEGCKQREQIENGEYEQPVSSAAIGPGAPANPTCEQKENSAAKRGDRAIHRACKPQKPRQLRGKNQETAIDQDLARRCSASRDNRQHRYARPRIVTGAIKREGPEVGWRPKEDDKKQRQRLDPDVSRRSRPSDRGR